MSLLSSPDPTVIGILDFDPGGFPWTGEIDPLLPLGYDSLHIQAPYLSEEIDAILFNVIDEGQLDAMEARFRCWCTQPP